MFGKQPSNLSDFKAKIPLNYRSKYHKLRATSYKREGHKSQHGYAASCHVGISWYDALLSCLCIILRNTYRSWSAYTHASMSNTECKGELNLTRVSSDLHVIQPDVAAYCRDLGLQGKYIPAVHREILSSFFLWKTLSSVVLPRIRFKVTKPRKSAHRRRLFHPSF